MVLSTVTVVESNSSRGSIARLALASSQPRNA